MANKKGENDKFSIKILVFDLFVSPILGCVFLDPKFRFSLWGRRNNTMDDDLKSLWQILEGARSPQGLLRVKIKEMEACVPQEF
eukprot:2446999-Amphidinium_carterae.1